MYIAILNSTRGGGISLPLPSTDDPALSDTSLRALSRGCRDLKLLFLAGCSRVSDKGLLDLKKLKHLHVLNLADCSRQANTLTWNVTAATIWLGCETSANGVAAEVL